MNANFEKLIQRNGTYSLSYLITLSNYDDTVVLRFVNDYTDITHGGNTYTAAAFKYTPQASQSGMTGGGMLEISIVPGGAENSVIDLIESYRHLKLTVIGVLLENGTVSELTHYSCSYGTVKCTRKTAVFTFEKDERLSMTFPALLWNGFNNRGNT